MFNKLMGLTLLSIALIFFYGNCAKKSFQLTEEASMEYVEILAQHEDIEHPEEKTIDTTYDPLIGERIFIGKKLQSLFGRGASTLNIIDTNVTRQNLYFGGGCSIYENYTIKVTANVSGARVADAADLNANCSQELSSTFPMVPVANVGRQAWMIRACNALVNDESSFLYFVKLVDATASSSVLPDVNGSNIDKMIQQFYGSSTEIPTSLTQSLELLGKSFDYKDEAWKTMIYSVCISSYWQQY